MIGVDAAAFIRKRPIIILDCLWHILNEWASKSIKAIPEMLTLAEEEVPQFLELDIETILVRWINYHLKKAGQRAKVDNLSHDLSDSIALLHVLNSIDAGKCPVDDIEELEEDEELAEKLVANLAALGVPDIV